MSRYVAKPVEVWLAVEGKVQLRNNREAWQYKRAVRPIRTRSHQTAVRDAEVSHLPEEGSEEVPF
jgi:hypothetical protein